MESVISPFIDSPVSTAALIAMEPKAYLIRLIMASVAFSVAMNIERVILRVLGFVWLLIVGASFTIIGFSHGTILDILLGLVAVGAAGYSWWYTRI